MYTFPVDEEIPLLVCFIVISDFVKFFTFLRKCLRIKVNYLALFHYIFKNQQQGNLLSHSKSILKGRVVFSVNVKICKKILTSFTMDFHIQTYLCRAQNSIKKSKYKVGKKTVTFSMKFCIQIFVKKFFIF